MRKLSDVFYIDANFCENYFVYYGMRFKEFIKFNPTKLNNILIIDGEFISDNFNCNLLLETANGNEGILKLCDQDIYGLGNFHWIDYDNEETLNDCTPEEKAEILYLSHFGEALKSPFFDRIKNNFCYLAHDDGWFCKLFCKDMLIFRDIIANKVIDSFSIDKRRKIYPMDESVKNKIFQLTEQGLLLDFSNILTDENYIELRFYAIGHYQDMDEMYNNIQRYKVRARVKGGIVHSNKAWKIYFEE